MLGDEGYEVIKAYDGEQGLLRLEEMRGNPPDLVLLDLMMPVLDGRGLILEMRADEVFRHIPILVMSAGDPTPTDA